MGNFGLRNAVSYLVILLLPALTIAATPTACRCGPPTPQSYKWNFSKEAAGLLNQIHSDAYHARNVADTLTSLDHETVELGWQAFSDQLGRESIWDNNMDRILCRLRVIEPVLPAVQQAEINKLTPPVLEITDTTEAEIRFLNDHQEDLFEPEFTGFIPDIYSEANRIEVASAHASRFLETNYSWKQNDTRQNLRTQS